MSKTPVACTYLFGTFRYRRLLRLFLYTAYLRRSQCWSTVIRVPEYSVSSEGKISSSALGLSAMVHQFHRGIELKKRSRKLISKNLTKRRCENPVNNRFSFLHPSTVASPGFVARRGKDGSYVMGHSRITMDFRAGCSSCSMTNSFVNDYRKSCELLLHQLISQTTQYLNS